MTECHNVHYNSHSGVKRILSKVRKSLYWKGQSGDARSFVDNCSVYQMEKIDRALSKGQLQSPFIPVTKLQEGNLSFITDLPIRNNGIDSILVVDDKVTRMTNLICCSKTITAAQIAKFYMNEVVKVHGIP